MFVCDFPQEVSPLARRHRDGPDLVERFEPVVAGRELGNAFSELIDPDEQRARFNEQAARHAAGDDEFGAEVTEVVDEAGLLIEVQRNALVGVVADVAVKAHGVLADW